MAGVDPKRIFPNLPSRFLIPDMATIGLKMEIGFTRIKRVAMKDNGSLTVLLDRIF